MYKKGFRKREKQVKKNDGKQAMMGMRAHKISFHLFIAILCGKIFCLR